MISPALPGPSYCTQAHKLAWGWLGLWLAVWSPGSGCTIEPVEPEALVIAESSAAVGVAVVLDGSQSSALGPLQYRWALATMPAGSQARLADPEAATTSFLPDLPGAYSVRLVVFDGQQESLPVFRVISVQACDGTPLTGHIDTVAPAVIGSGTLVVLQGSRVSGNSLPACAGQGAYSCSWSLLPPAGSSTRLAGAESCAPVFVPDLPGAYDISLVLVGPHGDQSVPVATTITATGCGFFPPVAVATKSAETVAQGERVVFDGSGSFDPDNHAACGYQQWLSYDWLLLSVPPGSDARLPEVDVMSPSLVPDVPGLYQVQLVVTDSVGLASTAVVVDVTAEALPGYDPEIGLITSVHVAPPLTSSGGSAPEIGIPKAGPGSDGYLSAADWQRFNRQIESVTAGPGVAITGPPGAPAVQVLFGTTGGTAVEGNDPRLSDRREALPGSAYYIQNQSAVAQPASFHIAGHGTVGGDLAVGGVLAAPHGIEVVEHDDPRVGYHPAIFTCHADEWCEQPGGWGHNRFSTHGRYTSCSGDSDCSAAHVELRLDNNQYRTVLLSYFEEADARAITILLSFDNGLSYSLHKRLSTLRASSAPNSSTISTLISNLPLGANLRVRVEATHGRLRFEGFGLAKWVMPEERGMEVLP